MLTEEVFVAMKEHALARDAAITAEINIGDLPFRLFSEKILARHWHTAHHDLHKDQDCRVFFNIDVGDGD